MLPITALTSCLVLKLMGLFDWRRDAVPVWSSSPAIVSNANSPTVTNDKVKEVSKIEIETSYDVKQ